MWSLPLGGSIWVPPWGEPNDRIMGRLVQYETCALLPSLLPDSSAREGKKKDSETAKERSRGAGNGTAEKTQPLLPVLCVGPQTSGQALGEQTVQFHPQNLLKYLGAGETVKGSRVGVGCPDGYRCKGRCWRKFCFLLGPHPRQFMH